MIALLLAASSCGSEEEDTAGQNTALPQQPLPPAGPVSADTAANAIRYKDTIVQAPPMQDLPPGQPADKGAPPPPPVPKPEKPKPMPKVVDFRK